ncbi:MAG: hypothetical protein PHP97_01400 [Candidatus Shapirobacteria bacterium]|nr:hypothetical protein [Candidatus Shapirobacteria bacterium]MDD3002713.1 hypothetical protein [Candidatus Shapirobacteria bacterium]MDD4383208.1 hypothetical protein [Candidatus Shapirobacteria bacterium]
MEKYKFDWKWYLNYYPDLKTAGINNEEKAWNHWKCFGKNERRARNENELKDIVFGFFDKIKKIENEELGWSDRWQNKKRKDWGLINILTRTSARPNFFRECRESVKEQTYLNFRQIVGYDDFECELYLNQIENKNKIYYKKLNQTDKLSFPYNLYFNQMVKKVNEGWIMYLDDDDKFVNKYALEKIMNRVRSDDDLLVWKVWFPSKIVPGLSFKKNIVRGDISGCGFMYHSKHKNKVLWKGVKMGDYEFINELSKYLKIRWISVIATRVNYKDDFFSNGNRNDKLLRGV